MFKKYRVTLKRRAILSSAPYTVIAGNKEEAMKKAQALFTLEPREAGDNDLEPIYTTYEGDAHIEIAPLKAAYVGGRGESRD